MDQPARKKATRGQAGGRAVRTKYGLEHLQAIGLGHLMDAKLSPPIKTIVFNHGDGRYHAGEQP